MNILVVLQVLLISLYTVTKQEDCSGVEQNEKKIT